MNSAVAGRSRGGVVVPHPLNELTALGIPGEPPPQAIQCCRFCVTFAPLNKGSRADRLRESGFERNGGESHPLNQKAEQSIPEREWLAGPVHGLSESNDTRRADRGLEWQQI